MAGLGPHLGALYYTVMVAVQLLDSNGWTELFEGDRMTNLMIAAIFLFPGVFALLGGLTGVWTWWMLQPAKVQTAALAPASESPKVDEYVIVSGRLTTQPAAQPQTPRI